MYYLISRVGIPISVQ